MKEWVLALNQFTPLPEVAGLSIAGY